MHDAAQIKRKPQRKGCNTRTHRRQHRLGAATLALYVAQGAIGLPVFAGFAAGPAVLMGPTGGYLVGFVLAAGLIGWLAERGWGRPAVQIFIASTAKSSSSTRVETAGSSI